MSITTEISVGEFLDKLTILQIKQARIRETEKLVNINREIDTLMAIWTASKYNGSEIDAELAQLRQVNEQLWDIEDDIRMKEAKGEFDNEFIQLARAVYVTNDRRARIKKTINTKLASGLVEEKSYKDYQHGPRE
jgi:hypothetical protein